MLLLYQVGSVKIGEVVRYTVTYTPSHDRILPPPECLHLRVRNTCAVALRAAFVHGPYTLSTAAYPAHFDPNRKFAHPRRYGVPEFEPMLKAGGTWNCRLVVPEHIRQSAGAGPGARHGPLGGGGGGGGGEESSASWIVEVTSQVIFSTSAAVHYEVLLARDEKALNLGSGVPVIGGQVQVPRPGRVSDYQQSLAAHDQAAPSKGVFSRAVRLKVEDTASLWNTPRLPTWEERAARRLRCGGGGQEGAAREAAQEGPGDPVLSEGRRQELEQRPEDEKPKKVHLVVLTHGLHSNLGSDMLFLKESIDAGVRQAKKDARARRARERAARRSARASADAGSGGLRSGGGEAPETGRKAAGDHDGDEDDDNDDNDDDDEEVIVRGFSGNATRTERGIKYLGKRLARYVLSMTYPDQPYLPATKAAAETLSHAAQGAAAAAQPHSDGTPSHKHSTIRKAAPTERQRLYRITKISFIAHSLGGLTQTYAIAYIQKHSPQFFDLIEPVNFIALATPFLGLNHENPLYVKFALDFGLVGRTGQDLGLTWRAPTIARNGWGALVGNLGENAHRRVYGASQPESKPLLRILPTGPAHVALKKFRNRTVYSNVVNDGIVPLRTSCLLFLDWQGLGRVEKARREAGLVETVVRSGWAELTGANVSSPRTGPWLPDDDDDDEEEGDGNGDAGKDPSEASGPAKEASHDVPQPPSNATLEDDSQSLRSTSHTFSEPRPSPSSAGLEYSSTTNNSNPFTGFFANLFRGGGGASSFSSSSPASASHSHSHAKTAPPQAPPPAPNKQSKIYQRSQTLRFDDPSAVSNASESSSSAAAAPSTVTAGQEHADDASGVFTPPVTTLFESAGDLLNPKLPSVEYLIDPSKRPRTIFHDRVYHPSDIPPPPLKKRQTTGSSFTLRARAHAPSSTAAKSDTSTPQTSPGPSRRASTLSNDDGGGRHHDPASASTTATTAAAAAAKATRTPSQDDADELLPDDIDTSQMKVEEKIARAYHRGLSWRKVLVKLEPDAHNNIIVRRMFANAFGWPVIHHLVEAHFSDSAAARTRDDDEPGVDRAKTLAEAPDDQGTETKSSSAGGGGGGGGAAAGGGGGGDGDGGGGGASASSAPPSANEPGPGHSASPTESETYEAMDSVSHLPSSTVPRGEPRRRQHGGQSNTTGTSSSSSSSSPSPRPVYERLDSVTWSDRDWVDSANEDSDEEEMVDSLHPQLRKLRQHEHPQQQQQQHEEDSGTDDGSSTPRALAGTQGAAGPGVGGWNWTEKIVGKGVRAKSPLRPAGT